MTAFDYVLVSASGHLEEQRSDAADDLDAALELGAVFGDFVDARASATVHESRITVTCDIVGVDRLTDVVSRVAHGWDTATEKVFGQTVPIARLEIGDPAEIDLARDQLRQLPDLIGATDAAEQLGVSRQRLHDLRKRDEFPAPLIELPSGPLWAAAAVRRYGENRNTAPGRPKSAAR